LSVAHRTPATTIYCNLDKLYGTLRGATTLGTKGLFATLGIINHISVEGPFLKMFCCVSWRPLSRQFNLVSMN